MVNQLSLEVVKKFNQDLDRLLEAGHLPEDAVDDPVHREMLTLARLLGTADPGSIAERTFRRRKAQTSGASHIAASRIPRTRAFARPLLIFLLVLVAACAASPTVRTKTKELLVRIGALIFTNAPTDAELSIGATQIVVSYATSDPTDHGLTQMEASELAGFTVLVPRGVPEQDWEAAYRPKWGSPKQVSWVIYEMRDGIEVRCDCFRRHQAVIWQLSLPQGAIQELAISDARLTQVQVRGRSGYWVEEAPTGMVGGGGSIWRLAEEDIVWQVDYTNILAWEEDGITYAIFGDDELSLDDLQAVADALVE